MKYTLLFILVVFLGACKKSLNTVERNFNTAFVVNGGSKSVSVINLDEQSLFTTYNIQTESERYPHHIYQDITGRYLAIANPAYDFSTGHSGIHGMTIPGGIIKMDAKTGNTLKNIDLPMVNHNVVFSPDGTEMWTAKMSHSGKLLVYGTESGELINEITVDADPSEVIFSADGKYALVTCGESTFLNVIDAKTKELLKQIKVDNYPSNVWPGYDNVVLVSNMTRKSVNFVDLNTMSVTDFVDFSFMPGFVAYNKTLQELWVCNSMMNAVNIFSKTDGKWNQKSVISSEGDPHMVKFYQNDEKALLINQKANTLKFIDTKTKSIEKEISVGEKPNGIVVAN